MIRNLLKLNKATPLQNKPSYAFSKLKALFSDPIDDICYRNFTEAGWEVEKLPKTIPEEELKKIIEPYQALIIRSGTQVTEGIIDAGKNLKYVGRAGTGVDNVNIPYATKKGILVMNTPGCNTVSAAEHTVSLMLALSRQIPQAQFTLKEGKWLRTKFVGSEIQNKTIGIIGFGAIGQNIAKMCSGFSMKVLAYDPILATEKYEEKGAEFASIDKIFKECDYITLHTPLTKDTKNLINKDTMATMKDDVRIINCARGGIINEEDLLEALENGKIGGAALDVFSVEPPSELQLKLINHPKVVATPHLGASTEEAQLRVSARIAQQITTAENGGPLNGVVNAPKGYEYVDNAKFTRFLNLGQNLGKFIQPITSRDYHIESLEITYYGPLLQQPHAIITSSILQGYLNTFRGADEQLNLLNINSVAQDTGIEVIEKFVQKEHAYTNNAIQVKAVGTINGEVQTKTILGSNFGPNREPHIIGIDEYSIHLPLNNVILMYRNENKPGNLSKVTEILAENDVNVENLHSGRDANKEKALTCVQVSEPLNQGVLNKLSKVKSIYDVQQISLFYKNGKQFSTVQKPSKKPDQPFFSSGPCKKHPEFDLIELSKKDSMNLLGRSHRSKPAKKRIVYAIEKTKQLLGLPEDYELCFMAGSDTGAFEAAMWNLLGSRPVDSLYWESFGKDWFNDISNELKLQVTNIGTSDYGKLPDFSNINKENDIVFAFNGTTSGVKVENLDFISEDHQGLTFADCTSAIFSQDLTPYNKLDVITYSFQKALGGEAGMGVLILSPKAIKRLEENTPAWPVPKLFRLKNKGKLNKSLFKDSPINTISMLTLEDYIDALEYVDRIGGIKKCQELTNQNYQTVEKFVNNNQDWISFLCEEEHIRSNTSVCLKLNCSEQQIKEILTKLESENIAYDINGYKAAPPSIRIWCGFTVESKDIASCLDWLKYYYFEITQN